MCAKSKAKQAHLTNLSKQNPGSQKATVEDPSDSNDLDWIPIPEMDEISILMQKLQMMRTHQQGQGVRNIFSMW